MTVTEQRVSEEAYQRLALAESDRVWELHDGQLREKPGMGWEHGDIIALLSHFLQLQLNRHEFRVRVNEGRVRRSAERYYVPDLVVVPAALGSVYRGRPGTLPVFADPLPLVVEVWSPSTGGYDVEAKLPEYRARGDREVWRIHPYERTLTSWRRLPDGTYGETVYAGGVVRPVALPGVEIDLDALFEE